jgi:hypothetical protein
MPASSAAPSGYQLNGLIERVTFFSEESGFCVLRVKAEGHRDLVTVVGSAPSVSGRVPVLDARGKAGGEDIRIPCRMHEQPGPVVDVGFRQSDPGRARNFQ